MNQAYRNLASNLVAILSNNNNNSRQRQRQLRNLKVSSVLPESSQIYTVAPRTCPDDDADEDKTCHTIYGSFAATFENEVDVNAASLDVSRAIQQAALDDYQDYLTTAYPNTQITFDGIPPEGNWVPPAPTTAEPTMSPSTLTPTQIPTSLQSQTIPDPVVAPPTTPPLDAGDNDSDGTNTSVVALSVLGAVSLSMCFVFLCGRRQSNVCCSTGGDQDRGAFPNFRDEIYIDFEKGPQEVVQHDPESSSSSSEEEEATPAGTPGRGMKRNLLLSHGPLSDAASSDGDDDALLLGDIIVNA